MIMAMRTILPPRIIRKVSGSAPSATEKRAAKTTSIVNITATLVADIRAWAQVWITKAKNVANMAVNKMTAQTCVSGGATNPLTEAGTNETRAQVANWTKVSA